MKFLSDQRNFTHTLTEVVFSTWHDYGWLLRFLVYPLLKFGHELHLDHKKINEAQSFFFTSNF